MIDMIDTSRIPAVVQRRWSGRAATRISADAVLDVFHDNIPYIHVTGAVSGETCDRLARACEEAQFDYYNHFRPPVGRIGVAQYEYRHRTKAEYFAVVQEIERKHRQIAAAANYDAIAEVARMLRESGLSVSLAHESGIDADYGSRVVRQIPRAKLHTDFAPFCAQGWAVGEIREQLSFNLYLTEPAAGGDCLIYNKQWVLSDDDCLDEPESLSMYGYPASLVEGVPVERIHPARGDIVFLNTRNYHEVEASSGPIRRLSLTAFFGRLDSDEILFWS